MRDRTFLALLVIASLAIKIPIVLFFLHGFGIDESLYLATARDYSESGTFGVNTEFNDFRFIAPLLAFVMSGFYKIFGESGPLLVSPVVGSLAIIPFFYLGKLAINAKAGRLVALFLLFNPAYFLLNTRPLTESIGLLLFSTSILVILLAISNRKYRYFVLPLLLLTFLARYPYGILLGAFLVAILILERKWKFSFDQNILASIAIAIAIAAPWFLFNFQSYGDVLGGPAHQGSTDVGFDYQRASWYFPYLFIVVGATFPFMLYGLLKNIKERKLVYFLLGFSVVFLVQFFVFGRSVEERYILPILPFASILVVSGYYHMLKWRRNLVRYAFVALMVVNILGAAYLTYLFSNLPKYSDTREAALWVKDNCGSAVMGNLFTPIYQTTGHEVFPVTLDPVKDNKIIKEKNINCIIVSLHESPYRDFFRNDFNAEKKTFGNVIVYKIS